MALIDELKEKREAWLCNLGIHQQRVTDEVLNVQRANLMIADLDTAISALSDGAGEKDDGLFDHQPEPSETGVRNQPEQDGVFAEFMRRPGAEMVQPGEFIEIGKEPRHWLYADGTVYTSTDPLIIHREPRGAIIAYAPVLTEGFGVPNRNSQGEAETVEAEPPEHISDLTGDPAIEPESGLHGEPPTTTQEGEEEAATLGEPDPFLNSILERGGTWHDGGSNPAPDWFVDIYVPAGATNLGDKPNYLEGQPSNAYIWNGWEVAYVRTEPFAKMGETASELDSVVTSDDDRVDQQNPTPTPQEDTSEKYEAAKHGGLAGEWASWLGLTKKPVDA